MAQLDWLEETAAELNEDPEFRKLGSTDLVLGLKAGRVVRIVVFEAFGIARIEDADEGALRDCEVVIEMAPREWTNYLRRRAAGKGPSLLALDMDREIVRAPDPLQRLKFERYHLTLQALVDRGAAKSPTPRRVAA